ncbi:hypothetical protein A2714_00075 [Candidatus Woesebacteria bacterium RIFCSPHIGHO2_01_FULL_38_9]|uniref:Uncharacterized protein n=2 Tax=Candidatus Woeseibacteriota TaxID=1752722 RepID=A0A1F7Y2G1_9BACT|nr:MAG: hypothetical protein A2714_00075 [Candidatus Woesebacteria bacterium RIFCSPHIGHO2_01_FULL_38_9]OGM58276.1 MAG: hypothetical protein A3A75_04540 [Candidatus Woesebacteria bacterium RIFCSPLOWO2_01_FULL_39_10]
MTYFFVSGVFEANSGSNSYKKSGKIGEDLNSWINSGSLAKITSGAQHLAGRQGRDRGFKSHRPLNVGRGLGRSTAFNSPIPLQRKLGC